MTPHYPLIAPVLAVVLLACSDAQEAESERVDVWVSSEEEVDRWHPKFSNASELAAALIPAPDSKIHVVRSGDWYIAIQQFDDGRIRYGTASATEAHSNWMADPPGAFYTDGQGKRIAFATLTGPAVEPFFIAKWQVGFRFGEKGEKGTYITSKGIIANEFAISPPPQGARFLVFKVSITTQPEENRSWHRFELVLPITEE